MLTYRMTPAQTDTWVLGGQAATQVEQAIAAEVETLTAEDVLVTCENGAMAFRLTQGPVGASHTISEQGGTLWQRW
jgi:hypothetical protein